MAVEFFYIDTIEQVEATEDFAYTVNEYGARTKYAETLDEVRSKYFKKLSEVANDLKTIDETKKHYYMDIKIVNSDGGIEEKAKLGKRVPVEKKTSAEV
jgi:hypothetical protein